MHRHLDSLHLPLPGVDATRHRPKGSTPSPTPRLVAATQLVGDVFFRSRNTHRFSRVVAYIYLIPCCPEEHHHCPEVLPLYPEVLPCCPEQLPRYQGLMLHRLGDAAPLSGGDAPLPGGVPPLPGGAAPLPEVLPH